MKWKSFGNLITAWILSLAYTITTLLNIIGPLHSNSTGNINPLSSLALYSIIYWVLALIITWAVYYRVRNSEYSFFTLIILGIVLIIGQNYLWGWMGS